MNEKLMNLGLRSFLRDKNLTISHVNDSSVTFPLCNIQEPEAKHALYTGCIYNYFANKLK